ncbi:MULTISPECIES: hypothetical protein [Bacteria]|jgi:hypothetical protein|nr:MULTISPECIES: hypothetical protein [Enterococcus]ELG7156333.1 hypothetical protein [Staphylococcus aureus]MCM3011371.1 hypothetical protein [Bacillus subtilis]MDN3050693.1 hypothetical protein [Enterococcus faecium]MDN3123402.1 hypothetical protein [Enterococcus faecalis]
MIFETYICALANNRLEYGFTFKAGAETDDILFDMVLGVVKPGPDADDTIERAWKENEKYAQAVCDRAAQDGE